LNGSPPVSLPISACAASCAFFWASETATRSRSSSISTSAGFTTLGSILIDRTVPWPFASTVTIPPPEEAVTVCC
jgi:hypothetical protein